jgi:TATA-binding protein-associated factor Taf7
LSCYFLDYGYTVHIIKIIIKKDMEDETKKCVCGMPLTEETTCACQPELCVNCCSCEPDCTCGCQEKKDAAEESEEEDEDEDEEGDDEADEEEEEETDADADSEEV